jgi:transglutaminase-like putative cysteine protease
MKLTILILCGICNFFVSAGTMPDPKYPVTEIPESLKKDVNVIIREHKKTFTIIAKNKALLDVYRVITILNENGKSFATQVVEYDKLTKIKDFNATVYDASGKLIKRLKNSEIYDQTAYDGSSLYSDNRIKAADMSQGKYPYTVEFEYSIEYRFLFQIPGFLAIPEERLSVQQATYTLKYPLELKPKFKSYNIDKAPLITKIDALTESMSWDFTSLLPVVDEPHGPSPEAYLPMILAAPSVFQYDDYAGSMNTWDEFGQWIASLNKGRDQIPEPTIKKIKSLTADLKTTEEKTKAVYHFLQNKTRYVGIQLGIGGYQPFEASVVDQTGYGDCKALSNYMVSMLKTIGIKSHYVLIKSGPNEAPMKTDFVSSQFNHAVVAVPNGQDTLWLECTSQTKPFGYAGTSTGQRQALLITDNGAKIANTPRYTAEQNIQSSSADVFVDMAGNATAKVTTEYRGLQYENGNLDAVLENQYDDQKKWLLNHTQIPSFDLTAFKFRNEKNKIPSAKVELDLTLNRFANVSGKRIFLTPNLMNRNNYIPEKVANRKTRVVRQIAYTDFDTIRYHLPEEIYPEFLPDDVKIKSRFGEYEASFKVEQGKLVYMRKVKMNHGEFPADSYNEFIDFYRNISKADNTKLVFMTKT